MKVIDTEIPDVKIIELLVHGDERGYFMETWRQEWFKGICPDQQFVQDNQSKSKRNTLRGLHYQIEKPQGKFVRALHGEIYDVAVDLRRNSLTFGRWIGVHLSEKNSRALWIPPGFGHGFVVLSEEAEFVYKCTDYYSKKHERVIRWDDADLNIGWPVNRSELLLSEKDANGERFAECHCYDF